MSLCLLSQKHHIMHCTHKSTSATTMSINQSDLSKKLRKAAINQVVAELVSAKQSLGHENKRQAKHKDYEVVIASIQQFRVIISKDALHQRVVRAFKSSVHDVLNVKSNQCVDIRFIGRFDINSSSCFNCRFSNNNISSYNHNTNECNISSDKSRTTKRKFDV